MKKYSYTVLLGCSLVVAGIVWGAMFLDRRYEEKMDASAEQEVLSALGEGLGDVSGEVLEASGEVIELPNGQQDGNEPSDAIFDSLSDTVSGSISDSTSEALSDSISDSSNPSVADGEEENNTNETNVENKTNVENETNIVLEIEQDSETSENETSKNESSEFFEADITYFDDALFIGDSRTVGLSEYGNLGNADVFADTGMSVFKVFETECSVKSTGKTKLEALLTQKQYGKVYIMLGINEMGYPYESTVKKYQKLVDTVRELQPSAIIFLQANLHVTKEKSEANPMYSNEKINQLNQAICDMADGKTIFYIDINEVFDDSEGGLAKEYTADNAHVLGKYYDDWSKWILTKAI